MTTCTATYSPEDNKLRLYASSRLDSETFARVKAAGFRWAPKQDLFFATWSPGAEDLATELAGEIEDEDKSLVDRAEERAERFEGYSENRMADAESARRAVDAIADGIPLGQPILVGHHSERHARRDAAKIDAGMRKAVKMWETSGYWAARAEGAIKAAKYKERPDVRARRIKTIEADKRKRERQKAEAERFLKLWSRPGLTFEQATAIANYDHGSYCFTLAEYPRVDGASTYEGPRGLWSALDGKIINAEQAAALAIASHQAVIPYAERWIAHYEHRLAYERAMLAEGGGTVADRKGPEKGGAVRCWASPGHGRGWSYIRKVNKVSVTVDDVAAYGGKVYKRTVEFDKLHGIMTAAEVEAARTDGRIVESQDGAGFFLTAPEPTPPAEESDDLDGTSGQDRDSYSDDQDRDSYSVESEAPETAADPDQLAREHVEGATSPATPETVESEAPDYRALAQARGAELITGLGQFRAGHGRHVTDWCDTEAEAWRQFCELAEADPVSVAVERREPVAASLGAAAVPPAVLVESRITTPAPANDPYQTMREALRKGGVKVTVAAQLFPTPRDLAARVVEEAGLRPGDRILEPSAGTGRLIDAAIASGWSGECIAVEINPALATALLAKYDGAGVRVHHGDFLQFDPAVAYPASLFDRVIMNPPFADQADIRHVRNAARFLKPGGRLVAIMSAGVTFRSDRMSTDFRAFVESQGGSIEPLPADSFKESGTSVNAVLVVIDVE